MSEATLHDRRGLLLDDIAETTAAGAGYLRLIAEFRALNNQAGMLYNYKCALAHFRSAGKAFVALLELDGPAQKREVGDDVF
ncbi:hypothetical protein [Rhodoblastus sp.]|uniref:hypothetical protein n=1 Tax=Rhodoblastus sp. TaxID=1962975 RepID=UPI003F9537C6